MNQTKPYKKCQSCGMPLKKDTHRAINENDRNTAKYCSHCYQDGKFTKDYTLPEMENFVYEYMRNEMKLPKIFCKMGKRQVHKLERWNN